MTYSTPGAQRNWRRNNPEKVRAYKKAWDAANPEKCKYHSRTKHLKRMGFTRESYTALFDEQGQSCAVCHEPEPGRTGFWCIDHDHKTGVVRGILCHDCNLALGHAKDSPDRLIALAAYLENSKMLKKHMTPLGKGGQLVKHAGKGASEQMLPSRSAMQTLTSGDPATRTMQDYSKVTPTIGAPGPGSGPAPGGDGSYGGGN